MLSKNKIKFIRSLQQKKCRNEQNLFVVEGIKMVQEALTLHENDICEVIGTPSAINSLNIPKEAEVFFADFDTIKKLSSLKNPQEVIATIKIPSKVEYSDIDIVLLLDSVRDPGNLGTILRICDWYGVNKIVCSPDSVDCYNPKAVQASMGAILRVNVVYQPLAQYLDQAQKKNVHSYGTLLEGADLYEEKLDTPAIIVMGNESEGLSDELIKKVEKKISIPNFSSQRAKTESLNVSIATAIVLSEFKRRKNYSK